MHRTLSRFACTVAVSCLAIFVSGFVTGSSRADEVFKVGFSKVEITPTEAMRLSGYSNRTEPTIEVEQPLWVRSMALETSTGEKFAIVSMETLRITGVMTKQIGEQIEKELGISRERLVLCVTHTHSAPYIDDGVTEFQLFSKALSAAEVEAARKYTTKLTEQIIAGIKQAVADLKPAKIEVGVGQAEFAVNRRVIKDGRWIGFGVTEGGPVDHSLPVLKITSPDGTLRGIVYNYASHCTSIDPSVNRICGDWAGYASQNIEEAHPGAIAVCTIGCGADQNPDPRGDARFAIEHGKQASEAIESVLAGEMKPISADPVPSFGYAGLPLDRLSLAEVREELKSPTLPVRQRAENLLAVYEKMRRLPESYPMPIHTWKFGDEMTMVFLGGEVVVQYAKRLKAEIPSGLVWVTAYANDVFGYVASEKMQSEGGYEVDSSMVFYNQPGRWASGTEDQIVRRVQELVANPASESALSPAEAVKSFKLPPGYDIEFVAAEPLITDPVNFAFGADGRLWVVEMGDYPLGNKEGGGKVKVLYDDDGDGRMDRSATFLDHLSYPNGVITWKKGVLITCAPDIIYAEDTDGDGRADVRQVLFTGFVKSNPQHRVNGFMRGLDNWIYLASGAASPGIRSTMTGKIVNVAGRDSRIQPDTGILDTVSGETQFGRTRDDWGNWFGNSNSLPLYHFVLSDRYLRRNPNFAAPDPKVQLILPSPAPPVYPASRLVGRFNDLYAANRFTSACGPIVFRDHSLGDEMYGAALVCEPVHNLVHRSILDEKGATYTSHRLPSEKNSEFLASTDVWSRPVRVATGPDGALWVADMYRKVIEHPQWIPLDWQKQINVRAGEERGRIYRVFKKGERPGALPKLAELSSEELVKQLESGNGEVRDLAQSLLVERNEKSVFKALYEMANSSDNPLARLHALCTLDGIRGTPGIDALNAALKDKDERVLRRAILLSEYYLVDDARRNLYKIGGYFVGQLLNLVDHPNLRVRLQLALSLGELRDKVAGQALGQLASKDLTDPWMRTAILSSASQHAVTILNAVLEKPQSSPEWSDFAEKLIATELGSGKPTAIANVLKTILNSTNAESADEQVRVMPIFAAFLDALDRQQLSLAKLQTDQADLIAQHRMQIESLFARAREFVADNGGDLEQRKSALRLLGRGFDQRDEDLDLLGELLGPQTAPELTVAAIDALSQLQDADVADILLEGWSSMTASIKNVVLGVLFNKKQATVALLDAIKAGDVLVIDLDAARRDLLLSNSDQAIRERAEKLLANSRSESRLQVLANYENLKQMTGNMLRGATLFEKRCTACHNFRARGNEIGPNLAALQNKSTEYLLTSILDPNQAVEHKYRSYTLIANDGRIYTGMVTAEGTNSVTIAQPTGRKDVILRADIDEIAGTGKSFMPEGLEKDLTPPELADVIAFVQSQPSQGAIGQADLALQMLSEAGQLGVGDKIEGERRPLPSTWLGPADLVYCTSANVPATLRWQSPPTEKPADAGQPLHLRIPVAFGSDGAGSDSKFTLKINGKDVVTFSSQPKDGSWTSEDKSVTVNYLLMNIDENRSSGLLDLMLSSTQYSGGESLALEVAPVASQNEGWFGIIRPVSKN